VPQRGRAYRPTRHPRQHSIEDADIRIIEGAATDIRNDHSPSCLERTSQKLTRTALD